MKKFLIAASCVSLLAGVTAASAQPQSSLAQPGVKSSVSTDISAAKKKKMKKGMMKGDGMQGGNMQGGGMQGGGMQGGGMQGGGMQGGGMQGGGMQR